MTENAFYPIFLCVGARARTDARAADVDEPARPARAVLRRVRDPPAGARALPGGAHGAAAARPAPRGGAVPRALRRRRGRRRGRRSRRGCARRLAARAARRVRDDRQPELLRGRGREVAALARLRARSVSRRRPAGGVRPARALVAAAELAERAFMAGASALAAWMVVEVAAFATIPTVERIEERNMFYVAPLFLIAFLLWVQRGAPRPRVVAPVVAVGAALLVAPLPFARFIGVAATADTLSLLPWWNLQEHVITLHQVSAGRDAVRARRRRDLPRRPARYALALPLLLLVYFAVEQRPIEARTTFASRGALFQGIRSVPADWIDRRGRPGRRRRGDLDRQAGRARHLGERVLQPQRRAGLRRRGRADSGRIALDPGHGRR